MNVLMVGRTGAGKSTLINYLAGKDLAASDAAKPCTRGIQSYIVNIKNKEFTIYDTEGYEVENFGKWKLFITYLTKYHFSMNSLHRVNGSVPLLMSLNYLSLASYMSTMSRHSSSSWFDSIVYCIDAGCHRVIDADIEMMRSMKSQGKMIVAITKCDNATDQEINDLREVINKEFCYDFLIIETMSKSRSGIQMGKQELSNALLN